MQETWVPSLGWEDPLEKEMAIHSRILAWRIPVDRGAWWATVCGVAKNQTQSAPPPSWGCEGGVGEAETFSQHSLINLPLIYLTCSLE